MAQQDGIIASIHRVLDRISGRGQDDGPDLAYPIVRSGTVLKSARVLESNEAVWLARELFENAALLAEAFAEKVNKLRNNILGDCNVAVFKDQTYPARLRFSPAATVDLQPVEVRFDKQIFVNRACLTVCDGVRQGKLWQRLNTPAGISGTPECAETIKTFEQLAPVFRDIWLEIYNEHVARSAVIKNSVEDPLVFQKDYDFDIVMTSNSRRDGSIWSELARAENAADPEVSRQVIEQLLNEELVAGTGGPLPAPDKGFDRRFVAYRYPRHRIVKTISGESYSSPPPTSDETLLSIDSLSGDVWDDYEAICAVDMGKNKTKVYGIGIEQDLPEDVSRSTPYVVSGEISYELGRLF